VGATVLSDLLSLIVFAICVSTFQTGFSPASLVIQLLEIAIFVPFILVGVSRAGAWLLRKVEEVEHAYFIVMLAVMALAGTIAESINLPDIVGAFLAGLAVNAAVQDQAAKEKLEFFGDSLFIPAFFVATGFLIDPVSFGNVLAHNFALVVAIVLALVVGKAIASLVAGKVFAYSSAARYTMWALTLPQVAATLAAALVAYDTSNRAGQRLLDVKMMNVVLVLMLTTAILGPILTQHFARRMNPSAT
jgi:Kef-type K+ transport system membrane component KefB